MSYAVSASFTIVHMTRADVMLASVASFEMQLALAIEEHYRGFGAQIVRCIAEDIPASLRRHRVSVRRAMLQTNDASIDRLLVHFILEMESLASARSLTATMRDDMDDFALLSGSIMRIVSASVGDNASVQVQSGITTLAIVSRSDEIRSGSDYSPYETVIDHSPPPPPPSSPPPLPPPPPPSPPPPLPPPPMSRTSCRSDATEVIYVLVLGQQATSLELLLESTLVGDGLHGCTIAVEISHADSGSVDRRELRTDRSPFSSVLRDIHLEGRVSVNVEILSCDADSPAFDASEPCDAVVMPTMATLPRAAPPSAPTDVRIDGVHDISATGSHVIIVDPVSLAPEPIRFSFERPRSGGGCTGMSPPACCGNVQSIPEVRGGCKDVDRYVYVLSTASASESQTLCDGSGAVASGEIRPEAYPPGQNICATSDTFIVTSIPSSSVCTPRVEGSFDMGVLETGRELTLAVCAENIFGTSVAAVTSVTIVGPPSPPPPSPPSPAPPPPPLPPPVSLPPIDNDDYKVHEEQEDDVELLMSDEPRTVHTSSVPHDATAFQQETSPGSDDLRTSSILREEESGDGGDQTTRSPVTADSIEASASDHNPLSSGSDGGNHSDSSLEQMLALPRVPKGPASPWTPGAPMMVVAPSVTPTQVQAGGAIVGRGGGRGGGSEGTIFGMDGSTATISFAVLLTVGAVGVAFLTAILRRQGNLLRSRGYATGGPSTQVGERRRLSMSKTYQQQEHAPGDAGTTPRAADDEVGTEDEDSDGEYEDEMKEFPLALRDSMNRWVKRMVSADESVDGEGDHEMGKDEGQEGDGNDDDDDDDRKGRDDDDGDHNIDVSNRV